MKFKHLLKKYVLYIIFGLSGALGGYLYWYYVGCNSGTCPITSKWTNSTIYGAVMGVLLRGFFRKKPDKEDKKN